MQYPTEVNAALVYLQTTGMSRYNYAPPLFRLLWNAGVSVPPPHFAGFAFNFASMSIWFGVIWGAIMWFVVWSPQGIVGIGTIVLSALAGLLFGLLMALYYRHGARKFCLPEWSGFKSTHKAGAR
ncbi:DUF6404 family protein [Collimonas fungivorans]|uniref:DUF6404 family protein n=1 Tax=Collimonas fungivorans TaxID=158899 RepID=UPI003FA37F4F